MERRQIVLDTNILIAALHSHRDVSFQLLSPVGTSKDDMVLELAVAAGADTIVILNLEDFARTETFGLRAVTPQVFLQKIGER